MSPVVTAPITMPAETVEYLHATITANVDVSADVVEFALVTRYTDPTDADWHTAAWVGTISANGGLYDLDAQWLYPANYTPGNYTLWVRVTDTPEIPVMDAGDYQLT